MYTYMYTRNFHRKLEKKTMGEGENVFLKRGGGHKKKWTKTFTEIDLKEDQLLAHIQKITSLAAKCRS